MLIIGAVLAQEECKALVGSGVISAAPVQQGAQCPLQGSPMPEKFGCVYALDVAVKADCTFTLSSKYPGCEAVKGTGKINLDYELGEFKFADFKCISGGTVDACASTQDDLSKVDLGIIQDVDNLNDNLYYFFNKGDLQTCLSGCGENVATCNNCIATAKSAACGFQITGGQVMGKDIRKSAPISDASADAAKKSSVAATLTYELDKDFSKLTQVLTLNTVLSN
jgi:hypothetical protein